MLRYPTINEHYIAYSQGSFIEFQTIFSVFNYLSDCLITENHQKCVVLSLTSVKS